MNRTLPLRQRRLIVVGQLGSFPLIIVLGQWLGLPFAWTTLFALLVCGVAAMYLYRGTGLWQYGNAPDDQLDERQVQIRNRAYRLAYSVVSAIMVVLLFYLLVAPDLGWSSLTNYDKRLGLFWSMFAIVLTLPSAILAWTESEI